MNRGRHPVMHERMVAVGGVRLCVRTSGERDHRAVLLIGGAHCSMDCWDDRLCEKIAANGRFVIRYDQRDTGRSACDSAGHPSYGFDELVADAAGVLDVLGVAEADVAGLSLGGGVAQRLALDHSPKVRSLTLISTSPGLRPGVRSDADLPSMSPSLRRHFVATRPEPDWASRTVAINELVAEQRRLAGTGAFDEHTVRRLAERVLNRSSDVAAAQTNHGLLPSGASYRHRLADITAPALVVHGTCDPLFPFPRAVSLAHEIPGAILLALPGVGHQAPPPRTWRAFVEALTRLAGAADERVRGAAAALPNEQC